MDLTTRETSRTAAICASLSISSTVDWKCSAAETKSFAASLLWILGEMLSATSSKASCSRNPFYSGSFMVSTLCHFWILSSWPLRIYRSRNSFTLFLVY